MKNESKRSQWAASASVFIQALISLNRLEALGFSRLVFSPGMLFDRSETWWPGGGTRPASHEGLDVCHFETRDGRRRRLDETTRIPQAFDGEVVGKCKDFLGETLIIRHDFTESEPCPVYGLYAHILPDSRLEIGDFLAAGHPLGRIASVTSQKTPLPPHLHLSFARADLLPPVEQIDWPFLNRVGRHVFFDPLQVLALPYRHVSDPVCPPNVGCSRK